jgi:hemolysin III
MIRRVREPDNGLTHLAGAALAIGALGVLVGLALRAGSHRHLVAYAVFGLSLVGLYTASGLYHSLHLGPVGLDRLLRLDCTMVFVLIAGTYTPFCLLALAGAWRWGLLAAVWGLALAGSLLKLAWMDAPGWFATGIYVVPGWVALLAIPALVAALPRPALLWVLAGAAAYMLGMVVFALERPRLRPGVFGSHALWHLLVLAGSACHVWAVARYLTPLART